MTLPDETFAIDGTNLLHSWVDQTAGLNANARPLLTLLTNLLKNNYDFFCVFDANIEILLKKTHPKHAKDIQGLILSSPKKFFIVTGGTQADSVVLATANDRNLKVISNDRYKDYKTRYEWLESQHPDRLLHSNYVPGGIITWQDADSLADFKVGDEPIEKLLLDLSQLLEIPFAGRQSNERSSDSTDPVDQDNSSFFESQTKNSRNHSKSESAEFPGSQENETKNNKRESGYEEINKLESSFVYIKPGRLSGYVGGDILLEGYWICDHPVTISEYKLYKPSAWYLDKYSTFSCPIMYVSWNDALDFIKWLNEKYPPEDGTQYSIPNEFEWEYACRAGNTELYCFGDDETRLKEYGWYSENSENNCQPIKQLRPNLWELYDMHGNVSELAASFRYEACICGGSFWDDARNCQSKSRIGVASKNIAGEAMGFRLVRREDNSRD